MKYRLIIGILLALLCTCASAVTPVKALHYRVIGIENPEALKNVSATLQNLHSKAPPPATEIQALHFMEKAPKEIKRAMSPFGYFKTEVATTLDRSTHGYLVTFTITPGPLLPITEITARVTGPGSNDPLFVDWKKHFPLKVGKPLDTTLYEKAKDDLYNIATRHGYFESKMIMSRISIDLTKYYATVTIVFETGPRVRFGKTTFTKSLFHEKFLRKFLRYHAGELYDADKLDLTQQGFVDSSYFAQVVIDPKENKIRDNAIPIKIKIIPRKSREYEFGLGYGTDTGMRGTAGITWRNIGGDGHRLQLLTRASQYNSSALIKYIIPGIDPAHDSITSSFGASNINQSTGNANNAKLAIAYARAHGNWDSALSLAYLNEQYNLSTLPTTSTELVYPTLFITYYDVDKKSQPDKGISVEAQFTGALKAILSETNFTQVTTTIKTLYTIQPTKTRLLFRTGLGRTDIANLVNLPLSLQLFAGGTDSVRGYSYNSIGPGRNLVTASFEIQQRVYGDFYAAIFADAGVVGNQNLFQHVNVGVGPGIVLLSSIGD